MASSSKAASALRETPLLLHLKRLPPSLHGLTFPELFFNPPGQPKRQLSSAERLTLEGLPDLRNLYLNDSGSSAPRRCFALLRDEELLLFAVTPERLVTLGACSASMGDRSLFVSCDGPLLERLFPAPLWEAIAALSSSEELLIAEHSPMEALRSWEGALASLITTFPELKEEVDLNARDSRRRTALHRSVLTGKIEETAALIEAGAEKDAKDLDGKTPLHLVAAQGDRLMVEALLDSGCDTLALTSEGENLLHLAVSKESLPLVDLLLQRPEVQMWLAEGDSDGKTPLHRATWGNPKPELVELLLRAGAEVDAPSRYGYTALHWTAKHGHLESARLILSAGARIDLSNQNQETPVDLALRWGQPAIVWLFIGGGGRVFPSSRWLRPRGRQAPAPLQPALPTLAMNRLVHGDRPHPNVAGSLNNLGFAYNALGEYRRAISYYEQSLAMNRLVHGDRPHSNVALSLSNLGEAINGSGDSSKAIEHCQQALTIYSTVYPGQSHSLVARNLRNLGNAYRSSGNGPKAISSCKQSLEMYKTVYKERPHLETAITLRDLGEAYLSSGNLPQAIEHLQQSSEMFAQTVDKEHPEAKKADKSLEETNEYNQPFG